MDSQEVFDKVAHHLLTQNEKSLRSSIDKTCMYRGDGGLQCAIGCLIPDEMYHEDLEEMDIDTIFYRNDIDDLLKHLTVDGLTEQESCEFLQLLQVVHDATEPEHWQQKLVEAAETCKLSPIIASQFFTFTS